MKSLINFSELSRYITGGDRNNFRPGKIPRKHWNKIDKLVYNDLPEWWEKFKNHDTNNQNQRH